VSRARGPLAVVSFLAALGVIGVFLSAQASAVPTALPSISISDSEATNYQTGTTVMIFTVTLSEASTSSVSVNWATRPDEEIEELVPQSGTLTFAPGETRKTINVEILPEPQIAEEEDEILYVDLSNPVNATLAKGVGVGVLHFDGRPKPDEVNIYTRRGEGQCVKTVDSDTCEPFVGEKQYKIDDIQFINPGRYAVDLQTTEGIARFFGSPFGLGKLEAEASGTGKPVVVVSLRGASFKKLCGTANRSTASGAKTKPKKPVSVRRLWGKGSGRFRTRGRYSSGTVRGTWWLTSDRCDGTRTLVRDGTVVVYDFGLKKKVKVTAGNSYLAKPKSP
jgi:hypothetical protein